MPTFVPLDQAKPNTLFYIMKRWIFEPLGFEIPNHSPPSPPHHPATPQTKETINTHTHTNKHKHTHTHTDKTNIPSAEWSPQLVLLMISWVRFRNFVYCFLGSG